MYRIIGADGRDYGPVGADELRQWISEGRANAQSLVQAADSPEWRPLGNLTEFAHLLGALSAKAPPPMPMMPLGSAASTKTNGLAIAGFIFGLLSTPTFCCCCLHIPCALLGLVFSSVALAQISQNPMQGGKGIAIAGLILSIIGLLLFAGWMIFGAASAAFNPSIFQ
jgi:hypothetical protein